MIHMLRHRTHTAFKVGFFDMLPAAPGIAAWGLMTGVAMVKAGLSTFESLAMTLVVFAGSAQLAALPLLAGGAPAWVILATAFCVNLRFVVFSAHLRPYMMHLPFWRRLGVGYITADLSYILFVRKYPTPAADALGREAQDAYLAGNCVCNWLAWVVPSIIGTLAAGVIPTHWGLGFAGILALTGILCSLASSPLRFVSAAIAASAAVAAYALPLKLNILVAIAAAVCLCLIAEQLTTKKAVP